MGWFKRQRARPSVEEEHGSSQGTTHRQAIHGNLAPLINTARRGALLVLDINRLSYIDLGYTKAPDLLEALEQSCRAACRQGDSIFRAAENRFVVVAFDATSPQHVTAIAERLRSCWSAGLSIHQHQVLVEVAIGVSFFPQDSGRVDELLWMAESAALAAHREPSNTLLFYTPELGRASAEHMELAAELAEALDNDALHLAYQPRVHAPTGRVIGVEALARWAHPTRGLIPPSTFVPIAEESGHIVQLTDGVLRAIGREAGRWPLSEAAGGFRVSLNISAAELHLPERAEQILTLAREIGLSPHQLEVELTETALIKNRADSQAMVQTLAAAGVQVAIDDFGTGYTAFSYLADFPVQVLKIDQSYVRSFSTSQRSAEMLQAMVSLGQILKLELVAEGAEQLEQVQLLASAGVDLIQGYAYARPGPADACLLRFKPLRLSGVAPGPPAVEAPPPQPMTAPQESVIVLPEDGLPLTPAVLATLFQLDPESPDTPEKLETLATSDPPLALHLLQIVAAHTSHRHLLSISEALARVGSRLILDALTRAPVSSVFLPPPMVARRLWLHSVQTALWAEAIAWKARLKVRPKRAYVAGLLHDIGRFAELKVHPEARLGIERGDWHRVEELMLLEQQQLGVDHATLGALACEQWGLPESLRFTIAHHHERSATWPKALAEVTALAQVVQVADNLSLLMQQHPDLGRASTGARASAIRRVVHTKLGADPQGLAEQWQEVDSRSKRACEHVGLRI